MFNIVEGGNDGKVAHIGVMRVDNVVCNVLKMRTPTTSKLLCTFPTPPKAATSIGG